MGTARMPEEAEPKVPTIGYTDFRQFCMNELVGGKGSGSRKGLALRGWQQLISRVPAAQAACVTCNKVYGECRCPGMGWEIGNDWDYREEKRNCWRIPVATLRQLTEAHLDEVHPATARTILAFVDHLSAQ